MVHIPSSTVEKVTSLLKQNECIVSEEPTPLEDITLASGVAPQQFREWATHKEELKTKTWGLKLEYMDQKIIATELAGRGHAFAAGRLVKIFTTQDPNDDLEYGVNEDVDFANGQQYKADVTVNVRGHYIGLSPGLVNLNGGYFPVAVAEIGMAQSAPDLVQKLNLYATIPSIEIYIAIKRYASGGMVALRFDRANMWAPVSIISFGVVPLHSAAVAYILAQWPMPNLISGVGFGDPACNATGLEPYVMSLPSGVIFVARQGGMPTRAPASYDIDLFRMQDVLRI